MNENTNASLGGCTLQLAVLETADGVIAIPCGAADRQNRIKLSGVSVDKGTEITLALDTDNVPCTFSEDGGTVSASLGYLALEDGTVTATLTVKRRGRATLNAKITLQVEGGRLVAPDTVSPEVIIALMSELARLKGINRKTQKRLRTIERSLGDFAWI